jgi:hypothetical protein
MKKSLLITALLATVITQSARAYKFVHGSQSQIDKVDIFVLIEPDAFKRYLSSKNAPKEAQEVAEKIAATAVALGTVLAVPTEGISVIIAGSIASGVAASKIFNNFAYSLGLYDWFFRNIRKLGDTQGLIPAFHGDVPLANYGEGAAWNWKEIQENLKISPNDKTPLYFVITAKPADGLAFIPYEGKMRTDETVGFIVKKENLTDKDGKPVVDSATNKPIQAYRVYEDAKAEAEGFQYNK